MEIIRQDLNPNFSAFSLSNIALLNDAQTVNDVLSLPFPIPLSPLVQPELFAAVHRKTGGSYIKFDIGCDLYAESVGVFQEFGTGSKKGYEHLFDEVSDAQFEAIAEATTIMYMADCYRKGEQRLFYYVCMSDRIKHGLEWHLELRDTDPDGWVMSVSSENGTVVVPNTKFREILRRSEYAYLLDLELKNLETTRALKSFDDKIRIPGHPLREHFENAATEIDNNVVYIMSALTPHRQSASIAKGRVFEKACPLKRPEHYRL